jgi:hypothetical protein
VTRRSVPSAGCSSSLIAVRPLVMLSDHSCEEGMQSLLSTSVPIRVKPFFWQRMLLNKSTRVLFFHAPLHRKNLRLLADENDKGLRTRML